MNRRRGTRRWGFSLLEVVIVVAIIAILAAIGIPRMSRGSKGANDSALSGDLAVLRNAIDLYATEHGGTFPTALDINTQLTGYTDAAGAVAAKDATHIYGPYLRSIPPLPVGANKGQSKIAVATAADVGWLYVPATGAITANTTDERDDTNKLYSAY
jgi:prepilin-type N-terminal cleavage/methylation domain-containing protein